jgi:hypothetical protein
MPAPTLGKKLIAKTFRKNAFKDLREDKGRVGVIDSDIERRLKYIRDTHKSMLGIKSKK